MITLFSIFLSLSIKALLVSGHGRLTEPPSRASAWRYGFDTPADYNDNEGFCGGFDHQFKVNDGKCGICGDAWDADPREHEAPNKFATGTIVREYTKGQTITVTVQVTANHWGKFIFKLCPNNNVNQDPTQECFDQHLLRQPNGDEYWTIPNHNNQNFDVELVLPSDLSCSQCILQWTYKTGNSWGTDPDGTSCIGCGDQEHFRACADIRINGDGNDPDPEQPTTSQPLPTTGEDSPVPTTQSPTDDPCNGDGRNFKRVCYYENWSGYRENGGKFEPDVDIDPSLCTHIMYGFATLDSNTLLLSIFDEWADIGKKYFEKVTAYKNQGVKVMIALGGWNDSKFDKYSRLVNDPVARATFTEKVIEFIEEHNFDGLDLDWEYPRCWQGDCNAGPESDKVNFGLWAKELSEAFKPKGLLLSAAVSAGKSTIDMAYDVPVLGQYLDFINVMTYDFRGHWDHKTGHHSPLYQNSDDDNNYMNTAYSIDYWMVNGAPREKLIMGMPLYGQSYTLASSASTGLGAATTGPGSKGPYTGQGGLLGYNEICEFIKNDGWNVVGPIDEMGPYAYKGNEWVSYDDKATIRKKCEFIKSSGLGGGMVWAMGLDDFKGNCGEGKYPLLQEITNVLKSEEDCDPTAEPQPTTENPPPQPTTNQPPETTAEPNPTTAAPNPTTTEDDSEGCRPTPPYADQPGMKDWCITNCANGYCPETHCVGCDNPNLGSPGDCRPTELYSSTPGMKAWCISNCAIGYCPASHCVGCENPNLGSPGECRPTELYSNTPGMKDWCFANCAQGFCPPSHCIDCD